MLQHAGTVCGVLKMLCMLSLITSLQYFALKLLFILQDAVHRHNHSYIILQHKLQEAVFKIQSKGQATRLEFTKRH